jgi:hypothetical protein
MKRALLVLVIGCAPAPAPHHVPAWVSDTRPYGASGATTASSPVPTAGASTTPSALPAAATRPAPPTSGSLAERYREPVAKIVDTSPTTSAIASRGRRSSTARSHGRPGP